MKAIISAALLLFLLVPFAQAEPADEVSARIVGGSSAPAGSWPSHALLRPGGTSLCGGTLVASRWVLTAAHCLDGMSLQGTTVALGTKNSYATGEQAEALFVHPEFSRATYRNDVALVRLHSGSYQPQARLARPEDQIYFSGGQDGYIAGWGTTCFDKCETTTLLRQATVPIRSQAECQDIYGAFWYPGMICAGVGKTDACQGDSGGPLEVVGTNGQRILAGIVSWGIECARPEYPGVYTDVSTQLAWIGSYITSRVAAPARLQIKGLASLPITANDPLALPTFVRAEVVGSRASRKAFRVSPKQCSSLQPGGSCAISVMAKSNRMTRATLNLVNRAGVVMDRVRLVGMR